MNTIAQRGSMQRGWIIVGAVLSLSLSAAGQQPVAPQKGAAAEALPKDKAILEIDVPPGTKVTINGEMQSKLKWTYNELGAGKRIETDIVATFKDGSQTKRRVFLEGSWYVRLPLRPATGDRLELVVQTGHQSFVTSACFSPDGRHVLTGALDGMIVWDTASGRKLRAFQQGVSSVCFSQDGRQVLSGRHDGAAALWDVATGKKLRMFQGHTGVVTSVRFSRDGRRVLTGSTDKTGIWDNTALLWDTATGHRLRAFQGHKRDVTSAIFSPDDQHVLTGSTDGTAILWNSETGQKVRVFQGRSSVLSACFSPDGLQVLTGSRDKTAILWDSATTQRLRSLQGHTGQVFSVAFSPDGRQVLTGSYDKTAILWDTATGQKLRTFQGHTQKVVSVCFSPDGRQVLTADETTAALWDAATGQKLHAFKGLTRYVTSVCFNADGQQVLTGSYDRAAVLWHGATGHQLRTFHGHAEAVTSVRFSADDRRVLTGSFDRTAMLWDAATSQKLRTFREDLHQIHSVCFGPSDRRVFTGSRQNPVLWDAETGQKVRTFEGHKSELFSDNGVSVCLSPNGGRLLTGAEDKTAALWDIATGRKLLVFQGHTGPVMSVCFSPDGRQVLTGSSDKTAVLWDAAQAQKIRVFEGHEGKVASVCFSPEGRQVLTGSHDKMAVVWDTVTGQKLRVLQGHNGRVNSVCFHPNGRMVVTGSDDGSTRLWDIATGDEILRLISLSAGKDWLVDTPEGLFEGSEEGRQRVSYRVGGGLNVVPVDRFFQDFYRPGLLSAAWRGARPMPIARLGKTQPPLVRMVSPKEAGSVEKNAVTLDVEVTDQGGGIQGPWLYVNGARVLDEGRAERDGKVLKRKFEAQLTEGNNRLEVKAASGDGSWESEPAVVTLRYEKPLPKPDLYVVAVGVSDYAEGSYQLKYAKLDAEAIADLFRKRGKALYADVHITTLLDKQAARAAIRTTMQEVTKKARPQDTLVLFLAGHGAMVGQRYYYIPHEVKIRAGKDRDDDIRDQGLPADVLGEFLSLGPAQRRILILDTCASGGAVDLFQVAARDSFAFRGDLERLSRSQGIHVLAATAAGEEAKEAEQLGHGVLTYTLLAGLRAVKRGPLERRSVQPSSPNQVVDVLEWLSFAEGHVRTLTEQLYGRAQNVHFVSRGASFPVLPLVDR